MGFVRCAVFHGFRFEQNLSAVSRDGHEGRYGVCPKCGNEYFRDEKTKRIFRI